MKRLLSLLGLAGALVLTVPASAPAKYWHGCGDDNSNGYGWYDAKAHSTPCYEARSVAQQYTFHFGEPIGGGWHCSDKFVPPEGFAVRCNRNHNGTRQLLKFKGGA